MVSYVGKTDWGGMSEYIDSFYVITDGNMMLEVMAMPDKFCVPFPGTDEKINRWKYPYSDGFFSIPSDEFSITTARGSMGLTVSAFRGTKETAGLQYRTYLGNAGFTNIYAFGYDSPTSVDSLSGVIGMKRCCDQVTGTASVEHRFKDDPGAGRIHRIRRICYYEGNTVIRQIRRSWMLLYLDR